MPNINETLLKMEDFQYSPSLDLDIVYYHIQLSENSNTLCTIILPWGNININVYQWEFPTHQIFSNRRWMIYSMDFNLSVHTKMTF